MVADPSSKHMSATGINEEPPLHVAALCAGVLSGAVAVAWAIGTLVAVEALIDPNCSPGRCPESDTTTRLARECAIVGLAGSSLAMYVCIAMARYAVDRRPRFFWKLALSAAVALIPFQLSIYLGIGGALSR